MLLERRGYRSADPAGPATFAQDGEDIRAVLGALTAPAVLFGHSAGALAALYAAAGDRRSGTPAVSHLCLYEPAGAASPALLERFHALRAGEDLAGALAAFIAADSGAPEDELAAAFRQPGWAGRQGLIDGVQRDLIAQVAYPPASDWSHLDLPTQVLLGEQTHGEPSHRAQALARALPHAALVTLPGQGHLANMLAPDLLAQALHTLSLQPRPSQSTPVVLL